MPDSKPTDLPAALKRLDDFEALFSSYKAEIGALKAELKCKDQIIEGLNKRLYGPRSERLDPAQIEFELGELVMGKPEPTVESEDRQQEQAPAKKTKRTRRKKADRFPRNLKIVIDRVIIPDEVDPDSDEWIEIGETHHDELDITPASLFYRRTVSKQFKLVADRSKPPVSAPAPEPSIPGTMCAPGLAAMIIIDKYCDHLPHYRQSQRFARKFEAQIGRQTLNTWTHAAARHLDPVYAAIKAELLQADALQVDETPIDYLVPGHGKTKKGYLWTYLDGFEDCVYFDWSTGRGHENVLDMMGLEEDGFTLAFKGTVQCDAYSAYLALVKRYGGVILAGCMAHVRRKFVDSKEQSPEVVLPILLEMQKLYQIEKELRTNKAPPDCRMLVRLGRSRPILEKLKQTFIEQKPHHLPGSNLGKALSYALKQVEQLMVYLHNGKLEIDNNLVENAIRPTKLGAKNYLFFGSAEAGKNSALIYTLIENCKLQGLDPEKYLAEVLERLPADASEEQAAELTPRRIAAAQKEKTAAQAQTAA